ncbi:MULTISPECIES: DNA cytosine methyltransferase [unclassified Streptomyces]|uniref:DNA cytosine methyltransferase n=1 Tax=unclassified Streptomyces TaxID=2593676 RepID=UPI00380766C4
MQAGTNAGFRHLLVNEYAKWACGTLRENDFVAYPEGSCPPVPEELKDGEKKTAKHRTPLVMGDVRKLNMTYLGEHEVDLVAGGPPCQPFSLGGVAKGDEDERNMFPEMFRAVREIRRRRSSVRTSAACCVSLSPRISSTSSASWSCPSWSALARLGKSAIGGCRSD